MDADRFGFDSTANYSDDPGMWMNSPDVKLVISLSLSEEIEWDARSLSLLLKSWKGATEVELMNRAARVTAEGRLPEWVQRWQSYWNQWEGTQWCTCAGGIPNYPTRMSKYLRGFCFLFASFVFGLQARWGKKSLFHMKDLAKAPSSLTKWCWDVVLRSLLSWQPPELLKEMRVRQHASSSHFIPKTNVTFYQLCKD